MSKIRNFIGLAFGGYTVKERLPYLKNKQSLYICVCKCGKNVELSFSSLMANKTGCKDCSTANKIGKSRFGETVDYKRGSDPLYQTWLNIKRRILNSKCPNFKDYGGRGLRVEESWVDSFDLFREYVLCVLGEKPKEGHSLDRIDNNLGYVKGNLRWSTFSEQVSNQRKRKRKRVIDHYGVLISLEELSSLLEKNFQTMAKCYHTKNMRKTEEYFTHFKIPKLNNYD